MPDQSNLKIPLKMIDYVDFFFLLFYSQWKLLDNKYSEEEIFPEILNFLTIYKKNDAHLFNFCYAAIVKIVPLMFVCCIVIFLKFWEQKYPKKCFPSKYFNKNSIQLDWRLAWKILLKNIGFSKYVNEECMKFFNMLVHI